MTHTFYRWIFLALSVFSLTMVSACADAVGDVTEEDAASSEEALKVRADRTCALALNSESDGICNNTCGVDPDCVKPKVCGTIAGLVCPRGEYCDFGEGQCHVSDAAGACRPEPSRCTKQYEPVCGCNGQTYDNACLAHFAGVLIESKGECNSCPDPNDPKVTYYGHTQKECSVIRFKCAPGYTGFSDDCGCGCIAP